MIYILETGEYSDYSYHAVVEGPDNLDVDEVYAAAMKALDEREAAGENTRNLEWTGDTRRGLIAEMVKQMEVRGCKEHRTTAVHLGCYGDAKLEVERPTEG